MIYRENLYNFLQILRLGKIRKSFFIFSLPLILIAMLFEGLSFGLLFPLFKRLIERQVTFPWTNFPVVGRILSFMGFANLIQSARILIIAILVAVAIRLLATYLNSLLTIRESLRVKRNLRLTLYKHLLDLGNLFFDQKRSGEIYGILIGSTNRVEICIILCQQIILGIFLSLIYVVLLLIISWQIAFLVLFILPIFFFIMKMISKKIESTSNRLLRVELDSSGLGVDVFNNIKLVKSFCTEQLEYKRFEKLEHFNEMETLRIQAIKQSVEPLHELTVIMAIISLFIISLLWLGYQGTSLFIKLSIIILIIRRFSATISGFNSTVATFFDSLPHIKLILSTLNKEDKPIVVGGDIPFKSIEKGIEFKNVSMSYAKERRILNNVSFFMPKGTTTALVGASGAGKTTIAELLPRFYEFQEGSIEIDGVDIRRFELKSLRKNIGIVSQDTLVLNDSIYNNIIYGLDTKVNREEVINMAKKARLDDFINSLPWGYDTNIGDKGVRLSGGELQRLSIARALLKNAPILILDEATSSIDSISEHLIQEALYDLSCGRTVIVIAHRLSTIMHADQILVLEDGRIIESGKLQELIDKKGKFYEYWLAQKF